MPADSELALFVIAGLALLLTPGPGIFYIVARSVHQGSRAGVVSAVGVVTGGLIHVVAGAIGLSALLLSSTIAFAVVKYSGALYLIYLGVRTILVKKSSDLVKSHFETTTLWQTFKEGMIVNLLNPKVILFFVAFLPQFVDPSRGNPGLQFLFLGMLLVTMGFLTDTIYVFAAGMVTRWFRKNNGQFVIHRWFAGSVYFGLGMFTVFFKPVQ